MALRKNAIMRRRLLDTAKYVGQAEALSQSYGFKAIVMKCEALSDLLDTTEQAEAVIDLLYGVHHK